VYIAVHLLQTSVDRTVFCLSLFPRCTWAVQVACCSCYMSCRPRVSQATKTSVYWIYSTWCAGNTAALISRSLWALLSELWSFRVPDGFIISVTISETLSQVLQHWGTCMWGSDLLPLNHFGNNIPHAHRAVLSPSDRRIIVSHCRTSCNNGGTKRSKCDRNSKNLRNCELCVSIQWTDMRYCNVSTNELYCHFRGFVTRAFIAFNVILVTLYSNGCTP